jgi:predicted transcriptional regulator
VSHKIISFRPGRRRKQAIDTIATDWDRDRSFVLNEAIDAYLEVHEWQIEHIEKGLLRANAGKFASKGAVAAAFARWRK